MKFNQEEIQHLSKLARISFDESESEVMGEDLAAVLDYVDELESAPTEGLTPISQISDLKNVTREDIIAESLTNEEVLKNAPGNKDGFFKVKKVF